MKNWLRIMLMLSGFVCIAAMWTSFTRQYNQLRQQTSDTQIYFWSITVSITVVVIIRMWDYWNQRLKEATP